MDQAAEETDQGLCLLQRPWLQPGGGQREAAGLSRRLHRSVETGLWYRCADPQQPITHECFLSMMVDLEERVSELENWTDGKGLIIQGVAETFCSGSDLNAVRAISNPQDGMKMCMFMQNTLTRLLRLPLISVALVEGRALGGGAELTTACDFRLMAPGSVIQFVHKHMGLVPGWGGAARLVRIVGSQNALKLLGGAVKVDSKLGLDIGLADGVLQARQEAEGTDSPLQLADNWLSRYTKGPAPVIQAVKKVVLSGRELPLSEALRTEKDVFGTVWGGPANLQALASKSKHK
ncbi:ethylmalonyl-CoA decarboxylase isoform X2 [Parambassis ranga]|uniref:Ethylmalonyl-CoA decarboxylase n=1 Tax=Parambassis ranga TaxID=210632 RepID=A0A6P7JXF6_9TELE|nr:ethylmalonyl-CoA decarboxylase isoform X2 [Parambassis ranga]